MSEPSVNIYVPTYEPKPEHLRQALASLTAQTYQGWNALVHDDGSAKVNVREILDPFLADQRITFKRADERGGIGGNWNACLNYGEATFVQYLFQDDLWEPEYLQRCVEVIHADEKLAFVAANHRYRDDQGQDVEGRYGEIKALRDTLFNGRRSGRKFLMQWIDQGLTPNLIGEPSFVLMRRKAMEQAGPFAEDMPQFLDVEYWTRLLLVGDWHGIGENLGTFRVHPDGASAQNERTGQGMFDRFRCFQGLKRSLKGTERRAVVRARDESLEQMIEKFFARLTQRKAMGGGSKRGGVKTHGLTFMDYPVLAAGLVRYVLHSPWRWQRQRNLRVVSNDR